MVTSAERLRLESAYATPADARPVLRACALGLLAVLLIALAAAVVGSDDDGAQLAGFSASRAATGR